MKIELPYNMNRDQRLSIETEKMQWQESPSPNVLRKPLEREKEESGEVTSVVQYQPGSKFSEHSHPNGEEIFVLSGTFEDENGVYPEGTYIRNPPGTKHAPFSTEGCILFVKLNQFKKGDDKHIVVHTKSQKWLKGHGDLKVMPLNEEQGGAALVMWPKGAKFLPHSHWGGEEIFVLSGTFQDEFGDYPKGTWLRSPHLSSHNPFSDEGCVIFVKTGHM